MTSSGALLVRRVLNGDRLGEVLVDLVLGGVEADGGRAAPGRRVPGRLGPSHVVLGCIVPRRRVPGREVRCAPRVVCRGWPADIPSRHSGIRGVRGRIFVSVTGRQVVDRGGPAAVVRFAPGVGPALATGFALASSLAQGVGGASATGAATL